ncbi:hypothetical protein [Halopenitus persicus]|uniref:Uncharacterized protein n=1 Tax=Halopenitus persicus TaxID=1048396 RepID=A0A1H3PAY3_9EURY|nr:hypothetical protein [Halopenitus persicus]SDY98103.1 hypothetical protein SAMN05216564_1233 [Halopenitus persicus]
MTSIDDFKHDVKSIGDKQLADLDTEERLRYFIQEAAEDREERIEWLTETAPTKQYEATDLEYTDGIKRYSFLSLQARHGLQTLYQAITEREADRDRYMAVMLLNGVLERLSQGHFTVDEYGNAEIPGSWPDDYGPQYAPDTSTLATKYRELWEDVPAELLLEGDDRSGTSEQFPHLAALGLMAYAEDYSGFDDVDIDRIPPEFVRAELQLAKMVVHFHTRFHGWRIFAEKYLDVTLDEFLAIIRPPEAADSPLDPFARPHGVPAVDEELCENTLSYYRDYLEAYQSLREEYADRAGMERPDAPLDLDDRAEAFAQAIGEAGVEQY